ncbi:MAG: VWA domain-containing protein [Myxococcales bacterium]|nr:MAG: VWA domain-containing protein [Myxococcales bacterium]
MSALRASVWLGVAGLVLGVAGACQGESASTVNPGASSSTGGTGPIDLSFGEAGAGEVGSAAGQAAGTGAPGCGTFAGLDECGVTSVEATSSAANVLLVIDKSSSMDDQPQGFELKKWQALKASLGPALMAVEGELHFGLLLYPFGEDARIPLDCFEGCCEVPKGPAAIQVAIDPESRGVTQVMAALDAAEPGGGTPTAAALDAALVYFTTGAGKSLEGDRFVLLATDGGPNCGSKDSVCDAAHCTPNLDGLCPAAQGNCCEGEGSYCLDDAEVVQKLQALSNAGIPSFVVGIPGTESYADYLTTFAAAGGVPKPNTKGAYYAVSAEGGVDGLTQTFVDITTHLVRSCEVELGAGVPVKKLVNVAVDCAIVPFEEGAGWDISSDAPTTLVLAGDACQRVEREGARRIDVVYGCPTVK